MTAMAMPAMVRCDRRNMTLTAAGCGKLYVSTVERPPALWESRAACAFCPAGAERAGLKRPPDAAKAAETWRKCCVRCQAAGRRIVGGDLCISCWNRAREARLGCDRKGNRPGICDRLHARTVMVCRGSEPEPLTVIQVVSAAEVLIRATRTADGPLMFGWTPEMAA